MEHLDKFRHIPGSDRRILFRSLDLLLWWILSSFVCGLLSQILELFWVIAVLGFTQWLVLRRYVQRASDWIFASTLGGCIGFWIYMTVVPSFKVGVWISTLIPYLELEVAGTNYSFNMLVFWNKVLGMFLMWAVIGVTQWLILQRQMKGASWWILVSALGGVVMAGMTVIMDSLMSIFVVSDLAGWVGYGTVTGLALVWLLRDRIKYKEPMSAILKELLLN